MAGKDGCGLTVDMTSLTYSDPPAAKRVLILAPHPDDETLGCGGTIALYALQGSDIRLIVISDAKKLSSDITGGNGNIIDIRRQEAIQASRILGIGKVQFWDFPDGELSDFTADIWCKVDAFTREFLPDIVFAPSPIDHHKDHIAVAGMALKLLEEGHNTSIAFYEVYQPIRFNLLVNISETMHQKEKALSEYKQSLQHNPELYCEAVKGLARFRMLFAREAGYFEAFWLISEPQSSHAIVSWFTYDFEFNDPHKFFLPRLKTLDSLLFELRTRNEAVREKDAEICVLRGQKEEYESYRQQIEKSLFWKLSKKYYRLRDFLFPEGARCRVYYKKMVSYLKSD